MSECLLYYIKEGITKVGQLGDIQLSGEYILDHHCIFINDKGLVLLLIIMMISLLLGDVSIVPCESSMTFVNGQLITETHELLTGSRIILGNNHVFRFTDPERGNSIELYVCVYELLLFLL